MAYMVVSDEKYVIICVIFLSYWLSFQKFDYCVFQPYRSWNNVL